MLHESYMKKKRRKKMQVCDFCGTTERQVPVRRLKLELRDPDPKSSPAWSKTTWWQLDLCREHW